MASNSSALAAFFEGERGKLHQFRPHKLFANVEWVQSFLRGDNPPPLTLELDPTLLCNDKCPNCVQSWALQARELSVSQIDHILGEACDLGIPGLTLTGGGDPLMHTAILKVIDLVCQRHFEAGIYTNGGAISRPGLAEALVNTFTWVRISLDSGSEESFRLTRGHGGYERRLKCLEQLARARQQAGASCMIGASFLTSNLVAGDIVQATRDVKNAGLDYIQFKPMIEWDLATYHHQSSSMDQQGVFRAVQEASALATPNFRVIFSSSKYEAEALGVARPYSQYHGARVVAAVAPNLTGEIKPTLYLECSVKYLSPWSIGTFDSLRTILESEERERMIRGTSSDVYCVLPEKGVMYSSLLDQLLKRHQQQPLSAGDIRSLAPESVEHQFSL